GDRQYDPQADVGWQAAAERRLLVFARPLDDRVRARVPARDRGPKSLSGPVSDDSSGLHEVTGWIGTLVSGSFLYAIAVLNVVILVGIVRVFRNMKRGVYDEQAIEEQLNSRGLMNRFLGRLTRTVDRPVQMYPIGVLFGLGFDTATEVALLVVAGGAAGAG